MHIAYDAHIFEHTHKTGVPSYAQHVISAMAGLDRSAAFTLLFSSWRRKYPSLTISVMDNVNIVMDKIPNPVHVMLAEKFRGILWNDFYLPHRLHALGCEVYHGFDFVAPPERLCKSVVTIHDLVAFDHPELMPVPAARWCSYWTRVSLSRASRAIVPSAFVRDTVAAYFPQYLHKVRVIHHGVDSRQFVRKGDGAISEFLRRAKLPKRYILYVGAMNKRKNPAALVGTYAKMKKAGAIDAALVLVGGMKEDNPILRIIENSGVKDSIINYGYAPQADLPLLYNGASAFVFPSLHEGFGLPVLEAMACGVPVIASAVSSLPEVVGEAGMLYDPNDEEDLSEALQIVLTDTARADDLRARGFERVKQFTWEATARKTLDVYREAVG